MQYCADMKATIGTQFGDLLVIEEAGKNKHSHRLVTCLCSCGNTKTIAAASLEKGATTSCGCKRASRIGAANRKHGKYGTKVYYTWQTMLQRCRNPNHQSFKDYGAKGVDVCPEWETFERFLEDMGEPPTPEHSIDRIDPLGIYCKENCRWASSKEQANNKTSNRVLEIDGVAKTLGEWAEHFGIPYDRVRQRLNMGYEPLEALTAPLGRRRSQPGTPEAA